MKHYVLIALILCGQLVAYVAPTCTRPHRLGVGPEVYFAERNKEGGSHQNGLIYGFRITYDRAKPWRTYWGIDGHYGHGRLKGHAADGQPLNSNFEVGDVEGRVGYVIELCSRYRPFFIPFVGVGYITQTNRFFPPVFLPVRFCINYEYVAAGFAVGGWISPIFSTQVAFKAGFPTNVRCDISNDPSFPDQTQYCGKKVQYWIDLMFTRHGCLNGHRVSLSLIPFYRYRRFGGREGFPFDFVDTQYQFYGARLLFDLRF